MLVGLGENFIYDLLTIAGVMTLVFRDLSAGLILLVPSVFPVMVVFGLMGWFGVTIDVGTIMTPTVALGVSVDDVVHFLIWYRRGLSEGKTRHESVMLAYEDCARAMYQSWSVLGLGLAVFALSSFVPTQRFGAMMFCLLTAALIGNLLILPAVLCSPIAVSVRPPACAQSTGSNRGRSRCRPGRQRKRRRAAGRTIRPGADRRPASETGVASPVMASFRGDRLSARQRLRGRNRRSAPAWAPPARGDRHPRPPTAPYRHDRAAHRSANR